MMFFTTIQTMHEGKENILMNGNRRALIVIVVSFLASDCIQVASKKTGGRERGRTSLF
jgi:hypothetical protein